ncbi:MAG: accessory Sec system translocase SecA2, partial [Bacillus sp. (in: firmicutes)]
KIRKKLQTNDEGLILNKSIPEFIDRTQRIVEGAHFSMREYNLKLDDVINEQRNIIYSLRNRIIAGEDLTELAQQMISLAIKNAIEHTCQEEVDPEEWKIHDLQLELNSLIVGNEIHFPAQVHRAKDVQHIVEPFVQTYIEKVAEKSESENFLRSVKYGMITSIDRLWITHLENMTRLKEGIGLRSYQQEDPMRIYQREGLELFTTAYNKITKDMALQIAHLVKLTETVE